MKISLKIAASVVLIGLFVTSARAQDSAATDLNAQISGYERAAHSTFVGVPIDWSTSHLVFSKPEPGSDAEEKVQQDPRYWLQQIRRIQLQSEDALGVADALDGLPDKKSKKPKPAKIKKVKVKKDWSETLGGTGATVGADYFPAKFSYLTSPGSVSCTDYAVYNTSLAGSTTQASIVSFTNIYSGCTGTVPILDWAYNTGGTVGTSVTPSFDGTQEAFVQSVGTTANLVLLKWNAGPPANHALTLTLNSTTAVVATAGTFTAADVGAQITATGIPAGDTVGAVTNSTHATLATAATASATGIAATVHAETAILPGVAPTVSNAAYRTCTAPCMTTIAFSGTPNDTQSSPYYVFTGTNADTIFVGDDVGKIHKFTGVFNGTPAEVTTGGFPVTSAVEKLSGAIYDEVSGTVLVDASYDGTSNGGRLHEVTVNAAPPAVTDSDILGDSTAAGSNCAGTTVTTGTALVLDAPLVDPSAGTQGTAYVFIANDGCHGSSTECPSETAPDSAVYQFASGFAEDNCGSKVTVGTGSTTTATPVYSGAFDNIYYTSTEPSPSGNIYVCGNAGGDPTLYRIPIASNVFGTVSTGPVLTTGATTCSPVTEFLNGTTDRAYLSVQNDGKTAAPISCPAASGCLMSFTLSTTTPTGTTAAVTESGGTSGIVIDNSGTSSGASQIYFSTLTGATAIQAAQAGL
jgi:hypothetical protein